jgi:hypothetical protein
LGGPIENLAFLQLVVRQPTLAFLLLVVMRPTLAFLLLIAMVTNSTGVMSLSLPTVEEFHVCMGVFNLRLPSNDGLQLNTSQYVNGSQFEIIFVGKGKSFSMHVLNSVP